MAEIIVTGHAESRVHPTSAVLSVAVRATRAATQADAVARVADGCVQVDEILDGRRADLVTSVVTSSLRTGEEWDHSGRGGRQSVGFFAVRTSTVACRPDGEALTELVGALAERDEVTIDGPRWQVAPQSEELRAVRSAATADARRRAEDYASGLGFGVGPVQWIAEPGLRGVHSAPGSAFVQQSGRALSASAPGGDPEPVVPVRIEVEPVPVEVAVQVAFGLSPG